MGNKNEEFLIERNMDINKLHEIQYAILKEFDRICRKHDLHYFLGFGSLIGAVRHSGFIPWDDDIDILMMYDELEKLKAIDKHEWSKGYFLQSPETDSQYNKCYVKIRDSRTTLIYDDAINKDINHGVYIDVEPLIGLSNETKLRNKQYRDTKIYMLLRYDEPPMNHGRLMYLGGEVILRLIPSKTKKRLRTKYLNKILQYNNDDTEYLYVVNGNIEMMKELHKRDWFKESVLRQFEDGLYPVPIGFDEWLTTRYGDYMKLPPKDQQGIKLEHFVKVDLENPYTLYRGKCYCVGK